MSMPLYPADMNRAYPLDMRHWPDLTALELLVGVADHGSVSSAARALGMARLRAQNPDARVTVQIDNSATVVAAVLGGHVDLGFIEDPDAPRGLHLWTVARDELVAVIAPHHPWARRRRPLSLEELAGTPLLVREPGSGTRVAVERAVGGDLLIAQELHSNAAIRVSAQAGTAPAVLSRFAVTDALANGSLLEVPVDAGAAQSHLRRELRAIWTGPRRLGGVAADLVAIARSVSGSN